MSLNIRSVRTMDGRTHFEAESLESRVDSTSMCEAEFADAQQALDPVEVFSLPRYSHQRMVRTMRTHRGPW